MKADHEQDVCNRETLSICVAVWGEQKFTPQYADITQHFIHSRAQAIADICIRFYPEDQQNKASELSGWIDTMTDGHWQRMHLFPQTCNRDSALQETMGFLAHILPEHFAPLPD